MKCFHYIAGVFVEELQRRFGACNIAFTCINVLTKSKDGCRLPRRCRTGGWTMLAVAQNEICLGALDPFVR